MIVILHTFWITISFISAQEKTTDSALPDIQYITTQLNNQDKDHSQSTNNQTPTAPSLDPTMAFKKECVRFKLAIPPDVIVLQSFKVESFIDCWRYCRQVRRCEVFSFHYSNRKCSLFSEIYYLIPRRSSRSPVAVAARHCLASVIGVDEMVRKSQDGGVLIENGFQSDKCLFATQIHVNLNTKYGIDVSSLKLWWVSCKKASLWEIKRIDSSEMVRISLVSTEWSLEWKAIAADIAIVYLAQTKSIKNQGIMLKGTTEDFGNPFPSYVFDLIESPGSKRIPMTNIDEIYNGTIDDSLLGVKLTLPFPSQRCSLESVSVKNGLVLNLDKVPFFLEGSTITVVCQRGYGVRLLNYTSYQVVRCNTSSKSRHLKPCSLIRGGKDEDSAVMCNVYQALTISLSVILFARLVTNYRKKCQREDSNSEAVDIQD